MLSVEKWENLFVKRLIPQAGETVVKSIKMVECVALFFLFTTLVFLGCDKKGTNPVESPINYRQEMRNFVQAISTYGRARNAGFIVIPQNGQELVTSNGETDGAPDIDYLDAIDGVGREDLFYGYENDDVVTPQDDQDYMISFLDMCESHGVQVLSTDYCSAPVRMDDSFSRNAAKGYISFAAPERDLNVIPEYPKSPFAENSEDVGSLAEAKNFLYLINPEKYASKSAFISALTGTNYDVIIMDFFFNEQENTLSDLASLRRKPNGGKRLLLAYMSIGEAEDYRYYWQNEWNTNVPEWLEKENPEWRGNYKVRYWHENWQDVFFKGENAYLEKIINAGFDGVYLDIIDAFEYFEN
jgi:cysteinyl-tRNA synthetase, unknown class